MKFTIKIAPRIYLHRAVSRLATWAEKCINHESSLINYLSNDKLLMGKARDVGMEEGSELTTVLSSCM